MSSGVLLLGRGRSTAHAQAKTEHIIICQSLIRRHLARKRLRELFFRAAEKRRHIIQELHQTEASYVAGLKLCIKCYYEPMKIEALSSKTYFTMEKLNTLFGNLPDVCMFHTALAFQLQERLEDGGKWDANKTCIGDILLRSAPSLSKLYISYCNNYERAHHLYQSSKTDSKLRALLQSCASHPDNLGGAFLTSYLITPVQRLPRYLLLLGDLLKKMPHRHPDYKDIKAAVGEVRDIIQSTESTMAQVLEANKILNLQARLIGTTEQNLLEARKSLRHEGLLTVCVATDSGRLKTDPAPLLFLLFNDMLLWVERKKHRHSKAANVTESDEPLGFRGRVFLSTHTTVQDVPDSEVLAHAFHVFAAEASLTLTAESATEKRGWLEQLRAVLQALGSTAESQTQTQGSGSLQMRADVPVEVAVREGEYVRRQRANGSKLAGPAKFKWVLVFTLGVRTAQGPAPYRIQRDYKQLEELSVELLKQFPKCAFTKLPKKTQRGDPAHLESMKLIVSKFLAELCSRREVCTAHLVRDFFAMEDGSGSGLAAQKKRSRQSRDEALHRMSMAISSAQLTESFARLAALDSSPGMVSTSPLSASSDSLQRVDSNPLLALNAQLFPPLPLNNLPPRSPPPGDRSRPVSRDDMAPISPLPTPPITPPRSPRSQTAASATAAGLLGSVKSLFAKKHSSGSAADRYTVELPPVPRRPPTTPGADIVAAEDCNPLFGTHEHRNPVSHRADWPAGPTPAPPTEPLPTAAPPTPSTASGGARPVPPTASWTAAEPDRPMVLGGRHRNNTALRSPRDRGGTVTNGVLLTFDPKRSPRTTTDAPLPVARDAGFVSPPPGSLTRSNPSIAPHPQTLLTQSQPLGQAQTTPLPLSPRTNRDTTQGPVALRVTRPASSLANSGAMPAAPAAPASTGPSPPISPARSPISSPRRDLSPLPTRAVGVNQPPMRPTSGMKSTPPTGGTPPIALPEQPRK